MSDKPVTVRLSQDTIARLEALTLIDGNNLADQIRTAVNQYVEHRLADPDLKSKIEAARTRTSDVLAALIEPK
ncbi:hypothetical protein C5E51_34395 [Nocardia nova]|uniref:hypothetical protein n=1 Tax=Nocardia nova TaxID=37330 RepID=UPI000CEA6D9C|nr:hypothetical protein [Nocardia nova]PPJ01208.1 hypothetical protein C5E51_34395 [Nocardia nova]